MKPFHLQIQSKHTVLLEWFGDSAIRPAGSLKLPLAPKAPISASSAPFAIDLNPLLGEIATGTITDEETFQAADEFLPLRDLLSDTDFAELTETLWLFLWREAQNAAALEHGQRSADGRIWADPDRRLVRVWFGTDRVALTDAESGLIQGFSSEAAPDSEIIYGLCRVHIPKSHQPGSTGTWWRRWALLVEDDTIRVRDLTSLPRDVFWSALAGKLAGEWNPGERNLFVYLHGYNESFEATARRAAQVGYDLKLPGEIAFYSWPSQGELLGYLADETTIQRSVEPLARFLHELSEKSGAERIHLFVHSMGNRGFLSALGRLKAKDLPQLRLGQVFFCAPDEDVQVFRDKSEGLSLDCENRTVLVSPEDKAVFLSEFLHRMDRVGQFEATGLVSATHCFDGMETIEVKGFGLLDLGHGYFAEALPVIQDMQEAIATRRLAGRRKVPRDFGDYFQINLELLE